LPDSKEKQSKLPIDSQHDSQYIECIRVVFSVCIMHWACFFFFLFFMCDAHAQTKLIGPADPNRITKDIQEKTLPYNPDTEKGLPSSGGDTLANAPENADKIKFKLNSLKIIGVESIGNHMINDLYEDKIDTEISLLDIYEIADSITKIYVDKGYILSRAIVPAQEIDKGNVLIKVVEGRIGEVILEGEVPNKKFLSPALDRIQESKPLNIYDLEKQILLLNDLSGVKFRSILKPSKKEGTVNLLLVAEEVNYQNQIYVNNYGSKFVGPIQGTARLGYNHSILLPFNQTEFSYISTSNTKELGYFDLTHSLPINTWGTKLSLKGGYSKVQPGYTQKKSDIAGRSNTYDIDLSQSIIRSRQHNLSGKLGLSAKNNNTNIARTSPLIREKTRSLKFSLTYDNIDSLRGINVISLNYSKGIRAFGTSKMGQTNLSRAKGRPDFQKYDGAVTRYQALPIDFSLLGTLIGQYTNDPLLSSEEFGYGGSTFGRAYDSSEILGDRGFAGMLELRYDAVPQFLDLKVQPFIFYDFGRIWNIDTGQDKFNNASSGGLGFRLDHKLGIFGVFNLAQPMDKKQLNPLHSKSKDKPRYGFQIGLKF